MLNVGSIDKIVSAYDDWSRTYESGENRTRDLAAQSLRGQNLHLRNRDVLEIGCGTGLNTKYLAANGRSVIALDFSTGMLEQARANVVIPNVRFVQSDIRRKWSVDDSSVDLIVCSLVLEHIEDLSHVFREARRVLRPCGEFLIYELHPFRQLQGGQAQYKDKDSNEVILVQAYLHSVSEFVNTSLDCGFDLIRLNELYDMESKDKGTVPRLVSVHIRVSH